MTEYYTDAVTIQNAAYASFGEINKFKLELDLNSFKYTSTDLTFSVEVRFQDLVFPTPNDIVYLDGNDIKLSFYNGSEHIDMLSLSNPGVSATVSNPTSGTWTPAGGGPDVSGIIYNLVFTINSALTSSNQHQQWISSVAGLPGDSHTFKLEDASSMRTKFENKGHQFWSFSYGGIYAFDVTLGAIPEVTIERQPVDTSFTINNGSRFEVDWSIWSNQTLNVANTGWQYSDDYDPNNPTAATWQSVAGLSGAGEGSSTNFTDGLDYWLPGGSEHPQSFQNGGPDQDVSTNSLTISQWTPFRYFRFKIDAS